MPPAQPRCHTLDPTASVLEDLIVWLIFFFKNKLSTSWSHLRRGYLSWENVPIMGAHKQAFEAFLFWNWWLEWKGLTCWGQCDHWQMVMGCRRKQTEHVSKQKSSMFSASISVFRVLPWVLALASFRDGVWPGGISQINSFLSKLLLAMAFITIIEE